MLRSGMELPKLSRSGVEGAMPARDKPEGATGVSKRAGDLRSGGAPVVIASGTNKNDSKRDLPHVEKGGPERPELVGDIMLPK